MSYKLLQSLRKEINKEQALEVYRNSVERIIFQTESISLFGFPSLSKQGT